MLIGQHSDLPFFDGHQILLSAPNKPVSNDQDFAVSAPDPIPAFSQMQLSVKLGTANVMSLYYSEEGHKAKVQYLDEQFHQTGFQLLGAQEARTPKRLGRLRVV